MVLGSAELTLQRCCNSLYMQYVYTCVLSLIHSCYDIVRFSELSYEEPSEAVQYLQTKLSALVDHNNPIERDQVCVSRIHDMHVQ